MRVKFKKIHPDAVIPKYAKPGDAGLDLIATSYSIDEFGNHCYGTGLGWEVEEGYVGFLFARSSVKKYELIKANGVGVIDSGYRGEISVVFKEDRSSPKNIYKVGDKIAQLVIVQLPKIEIEEVETLNESERGVGGFGSTGS
jgi:dUTP pyrophosphatase